MPPVSEAQRRWAFANAGKKTREGRAAKKFADADRGGKLPPKVKDGEPTRSEKWYGKKKG